MLFTDQLNRKIELSSFPKRIISLVPSQTELLYDIGLREEVLGITRFCVHPDEWFRSKTRVGGTKKINAEKIKALQPDLIIGNKEENEKEQIEKLMENYPVWMSDIHDLKDALDMITRIGALTGKNEQAIRIRLDIGSRFAEFEGRMSSGQKIPTAYFIWRKPYMVAGQDTFISDMLMRCGMVNVFGGASRYPQIGVSELQAADPSLVLLSSEPYPFAEAHMEELRQLLPHARIRLVDGEMFSWYGSRLLRAPAYFSELIQGLM